MEIRQQLHDRDPVRERTGFISAEMRALLAATASDVCALTHAPFCALSRVHGDDAGVLAVHGARNPGAPPPDLTFRTSR
jgi:hypothetical protein